MKFTDIFIRRPVLASVISLLILLFGVRALNELPLRQFPEINTAVISITTSYPGADAELIQGFITTPLQKAMASADGIEYIKARSKQGKSSIYAHIKLNYDIEKAFTDINSKVAVVRKILPTDSDDPIVSKNTGEDMALMYISFNSADMTQEQITDYIARVVQPKLETIEGVATAEIMGGRKFAMRVWLDPVKMAAFHMTPTEISNTLKKKNFLAAAGHTKGEFVTFDIKAITDLHSVDEFKNIIVKSIDGSMVRLKDIADVELGSESYDSSISFGGKKAVFIGINGAPTANPLTVIKQVKKVLPQLEAHYPPSLSSTSVFDATEYIRASIHEVIKTIALATIIVIAVIYLFLGALRSVLIPVITIPLSLIGVCTFMLALGYSINLLTLLALVLAIGLVVDDAIVVVENIHRHIEDGLTPLDAALKGAREIAAPVVTMTITLAAVYAPIGFMGGLTGSLFSEFAFTLASTVILSGIIALTLSPMMCSKLLTPELGKTRFVQFVDNKFDKLKSFYQKRLHNSLNFRPVTFVFATTVLLSTFFLYNSTQHELAPNEDQGVIFVMATAPEYANIDYVTKFTQQFDKIFESLPEMDNYFIVNGMGAVNNVMSGLMLKPWNERSRSQEAIKNEVQSKLNGVAGLKSMAFEFPSLPSAGGGMPVEFVLTTTGSHRLLYQSMEKLLEAAKHSGLFMFVNSDLRFNKPQLEINIDRSKAADLNINMDEVAGVLANALGGGKVNQFSMQGRSYNVIPQLKREFRLNPQQIRHLYVKTGSGDLVPLSTIATVSQTVVPNALKQFQQLNAATLQGMMMPGLTLGTGLDYLKNQANKILPDGVSYDFSGQSRQFINEGNNLTYTFFLALLVIFLVLAAQFESFRDPLIILISVPMSICGALIPLNLGAATINIYTQVGLITLIGLISKHGILLVDFANQLQIKEGLTVRDAIEKAASIRLRPILMTTAAMILGVMPLILASGAGAESRKSIGIVVASGMFFGTLFTLFVVPAMYTLLSRPRTTSSV